VANAIYRNAFLPYQTGKDEGNLTKVASGEEKARARDFDGTITKSVICRRDRTIFKAASRDSQASFAPHQNDNYSYEVESFGS
jgi:hypothetical protein